MLLLLLILIINTWFMRDTPLPIVYIIAQSCIRRVRTFIDPWFYIQYIDPLNKVLTFCEYIILEYLMR